MRPLRFLRALFLVILAVMLVIDLLAFQVGWAVDRTVLSPGFIVGLLDRVNTFETARDLLVKSLGGMVARQMPEGADVLSAAVGDALSAQVVREQVVSILAGAETLLNDPQTKNPVVIDLTKFREALAKALETRAKAAGAATWQINAVKKELNRSIPERIDLLKELEVSQADLAKPAEYYRWFRQGLTAMAGLVAFLSLVMVLVAGRKAWGPWLGMPFVLGGLTIGAGVVVAKGVVLSILADPARIALPDISGLDAKAIGAMARTAVNAFGQRFLLISAAVAAVGVAVWILGAVTARATAARPESGPPITTGGGPSAPPAEPGSPAQSV